VQTFGFIRYCNVQTFTARRRCALRILRHGLPLPGAAFSLPACRRISHSQDTAGGRMWCAVTDRGRLLVCFIANF